MMRLHKAGHLSVDDRQRAEETKFQHDQELQFRARNRRNKLFGLWIAREHLRLPEAEQAEYALSVVMADFEHPGDEDVIAKVRSDLLEKGIDLSAHILERHLLEFEHLARRQVMSE
jgi:hypothetical protein